MASNEPRTAQTVFAELLRRDVVPTLRGHGFKRSANTFHRAAGENWLVINFQKLSSSNRARAPFTINLGVWVRSLQGDFPLPDGKRPPEGACHLRERIGPPAELQLAEDARWGWWEVLATSDAAALGQMVCQKLDEVALPWLEARSTEEAIITTLSKDSQARMWGNLRTLGRLASQRGLTALAAQS